nr:MAG TPA: hypothetical protein [Caudoviricetes sp.]
MSIIIKKFLTNNFKRCILRSNKLYKTYFSLTICYTVIKNII